MQLSARGLTLIEMVIVVTIVGILATIAYPSYQSYLAKSARAQGKHCLVEVQQRMEKFFVRNHRYATSIGALGYDVDEKDQLQCSDISDGSPTGRSYSMAISTPSSTGCSNAICYELIASPTGSQAADGALSLVVKRTTATPDGRPDVQRYRTQGSDKTSW